jgi:branched-chain amino acid transport system permease protein
LPARNRALRLRRVHARGHVAEILFTFGLAYVIEELVTMIWGRNAVANTVPAAIDFPLLQVFGSTFPAYKGLMMAISVTMFAFLYVALKKTRIGLVIQAALTHPQMVSALGHDVPGVFVLVFAIGSALAGLAGVIGGFTLLTPSDAGSRSRLDCFRRRRRRRTGLALGALIASLMIGILQTFAVAVDYSLLDLMRSLGVGLGRGSPFYELASIKLATAAPIVPYLLPC